MFTPQLIHQLISGFLDLFIQICIDLAFRIVRQLQENASLPEQRLLPMTKNFHINLKQSGSLTIEAILILPFFLAFLLSFQALINLTSSQLALHMAVSETAKQTAANLYPIQGLYREAEMRVAQTKTVIILSDVWNKLQKAQDLTVNTESLIERYSTYLPKAVIELVRLEKEKRELIERYSQETYERIKQETFNAAVNRAFTEVAYTLIKPTFIKKQDFKVTKVEFPDLTNVTDRYFTIEAEVMVTINIPFIKKKLRLSERATERVWIDSSL